EAGFDAEGKPEAAVVKALADEQPSRRALAAEILGQRGVEPRDGLRRLLDDPKGSVRLRAALALTQAREPKAVSVLIALLGELPTSLVRDAEEFLIGLAAEQSPKEPIGTATGPKVKARDAWAAWWNKTEDA